MRSTTLRILVALGTICLVALALATVGSTLAEEPAEPPKGPAPSVDAVQIEQPVLSFREGDDGPLPRPTHPPIDEIPPMPMPYPSEPEELLAPREPGGAVLHDALTGETIISPVDPAALSGEAGRGGGYDGADGGGDSELVPATFNDMFQINNTGDFPWRMNTKLVMRFEDAGGNDQWFVCSGSMRDPEVILTAGHCVYDYGGFGWAEEIWVYPGWDGDWAGPLPPPWSEGAYGWGHGTYFGAGSNWFHHGDWDADVGLVGVTRAVGMLTGWFGWAYGGDCSWHLGTTYNNASYPSQNCPLAGLHNGRDMYYWWGNFDSCPGNRLQLDTGGGNCFDTVWGGMSGSGAYFFEDDSRYVHAVCSTSNRTTIGRYARQWEGWVDWTNDHFIPNVRGDTFDLQALDCNAEPETIQAGTSTTLLNHLATNPTDGSASGDWIFRVYLSTNDYISAFDTYLGAWSYDWDFGPMSSVRVNMAPVTIPVDTPAGDYWIGVVYDPGTDGNPANNATHGWDAAPIQVQAAPDLIVQSIEVASPSTPIGQPVAMSVSIKNQGLGPAAALIETTESRPEDAGSEGEEPRDNSFWTDLYLDRRPQGVGDLSDFVYWSTDSLAAGEVKELTTGRIFDEAGIHYLWAQVDSGGDVIETNEDNNIAGPIPFAVGMSLSRGFSADFDGDGKADPAVWMNRNRFLWRESASGYDVASLWMGRSGDIPVVADYDGDGKMDLAIWRNSNRFIWLESSKDYATPAGSAWIGNPDAIPVPGDWDGDGKADPAVWTGNRFIWLESGSGYAVKSVWMGSPGDVPVPADYDGDGKMDPAIWRNNNQLIWLESSNDYATARSVWIGGPAAIPVPGDWDGDGKADPAVWTGNRFIWLESGSGYAVNSVWMGTPGDIPVPGDYDGDGKMDPAIWRNNNRLMWLESSNGYAPPAGSTWIGNDSSVPVP